MDENPYRAMLVSIFLREKCFYLRKYRLTKNYITICVKVEPDTLKLLILPDLHSRALLLPTNWKIFLAVFVFIIKICMFLLNLLKIRYTISQILNDFRLTRESLKKTKIQYYYLVS